MALNPATLKADLLLAYNDAKNGVITTESEFAERMSLAIDAYIKTALVTVYNVQPGTGQATGGLT